MKSKAKKKRPVSRSFWRYINMLPASLRAKVIRSQFEVDYDLPPELTLRQAETADEIRQALKIVHDAYVELNYMDAKESQLRFSKFHALPTSVILIAKWNDEVIGTMTIVPDSALGLPADATWSLDKYRKKGKLIAEISSLSIKKNFKMRRGKLLLPLCKLMYLCCTEILRLDGIVIATTLEVEPFYTDVLLFEKVVETTGQAHGLVKGNPSTCCFLYLNKGTVQDYKNVYGDAPKKRNLHHFFVVEHTENIQLPEAKNCLQAYLLDKNAAQAQMINTDQKLTDDFTDHDKQIIKNLDISNVLPVHFETNRKFSRKTPRPEIRMQGWAFFKSAAAPVQFQFIDVSDTGFQINIKGSDRHTFVGEELLLVVQVEGTLLQCNACVRWVKWETRLGCVVIGKNKEWENFVAFIGRELSGVDENANVLQFRNKKVG